MEPQTPRRRIALVDGNSFYCSCEQSLNPSLQQQLVVLSNNDGCAISRTPEAKALNIAMGAPWFQIKHLQRSHGLQVRSANFNLYGDLSHRMMSILHQYSALVQVYSIDEAFVDLSGSHDTGRHIAQRMKAQIRQWLGLPICVGIGSTHTLAKLANHYAKLLPRLNGVCDLSTLDHTALLRALRHAPVEKVWGIGRRLAPQLRTMGIHTAADLAQAPIAALQKQFSIVLARTAKELRGQSCLVWEDHPEVRQQIMHSRSFGEATNDKTQLAQAISTFISAAAQRLRSQASVAGAVQVFICTSRHSKQPYGNSTVIPLLQASDNLLVLNKAALQGLEILYRREYRYNKAGVRLLDVSAAQHEQQGSFQFEGNSSAYSHKQSTTLMQTLDSLNQRFGYNRVQLASALAPTDASWLMQQQYKSPSYTTNWSDLLWVG